MIWLILVLVAGGVALVAQAALTGRVRLDGMPAAVRSVPGTGLPADPVADDLDQVRFDTALRGYDPLAVDRHLDALRDALRGEGQPPDAEPRFELVLRGYRMDQVDAVVATLARPPAPTPVPAVPVLVGQADPGDPDAGEQPRREPAPDAPPGPGPAAYRQPRPLRRIDWLVAAVFAAMAFWLLSKLFADVRGGYLSHGVQDQQAFEWYFGAAAHALASASNPLLSTLQNYPAGVNMLANASVLGLSIPLVPVTWLAGPQLTFALVEWIGYAATATCWYLLFVRRLHAHRVAAAVGGALVGFSPPMVSHGNGHPNFLAQFLVPVIVDRILALQAPGRSRRQTVLAGVGLGLLVTWQLWMGEEVLLFAAIGIAIVGFVGLLHGGLALRAMVPGLAVGVATTAALFAFPLWWQFRGPQSYTTMWNPIANNDLASLWARPVRSWGVDQVASSHLSMNLTEQNAFFGIPLWLFLIGATILCWRSVAVRAAAVLVVVTTWLSLGSDVTLNGASVPFPPLWPLVSRLPLFDSLLATRFTLIAVPGMAVIVVVALDRAFSLASRQRYAAVGRALPPYLPLAAAGLATVVALAPILPTRLWVDPRPAVPVFFTSGSWRQWVDYGAVLAVPPPDIVDMRATDWQAAARWQFPLVEGYFLGPDGSGTGTGTRGAARRAFSQWLAEVVQTGQARTAGPEEVTRFHDDLRVWGVDAVVLPPRADALVLQQSVTSVLGEPVAVDDVLVWDVRPLSAS